MKKLALLLAFVFVLSFSLSFADVVIPDEGEAVETTEPVEPTEDAVGEEAIEGEEQEIEVIASEEIGEPENEEVDSGEYTPTNEETNEENVEPEKTSNPIGGIVAIVVVVVLVLLVALVSKK